MPGDSDWSQRYCDHVEVIGQLAPVELDGVDAAQVGGDAGAFEVAREGEREPLLLAGGDEDFEGEGRAGLAVAQHGVDEIEAGLRQQRQRLLQRVAVAAGGVGRGRGPFALEHVVAHGARKGGEQLRSVASAGRPTAESSESSK